MAQFRGQPVSDRGNDLNWLVVVCDDVLAADVADESLKAEPVAVQHQAGLLPLPAVAEAVGAQEQPELKRHVESGQALGVRFGAGEIVDTPAAVPDDGGDLVDPDGAGVVSLERTTGPAAAG